jgi:hypothetical protein
MHPSHRFCSLRSSAQIGHFRTFPDIDPRRGGWGGLGGVGAEIIGPDRVFSGVSGCPFVVTSMHPPGTHRPEDGPALLRGNDVVKELAPYVTLVSPPTFVGGNPGDFRRLDVRR